MFKRALLYKERGEEEEEEIFEFRCVSFFGGTREEIKTKACNLISAEAGIVNFYIILRHDETTSTAD